MIHENTAFIKKVFMKKELTVIIPTLQKNPLLPLLLRNLHDDVHVKEIIIIDNSGQGLSFPSGKMKVLALEENIFVNPAWNLGMQHCNTEYWCLMNDDIMISPQFCSLVLSLLEPSMGLVGIMGDFVKSVDLQKYKYPIVPAEKIYLREMNHLCYWFGIAMFGHRNSYVPIPEELKVFYGDNYLLHVNRTQGKLCYAICGQELYHLGSLSSSEVSHLGQLEKPIYEQACKKYTAKWATQQAFKRF